jgi:endonuclease YncB( thermonuclease family)
MPEPETCAFAYTATSDGDTIKGVVIQKVESWVFGRYEVERDERIRLAGVDCPERGEEGWAVCRDWTRAWCERHLADGGTLIAYMREKYGRLFGSVVGVGGANLVWDMLAAPELKPYVREMSIERQMEELAE